MFRSLIGIASSVACAATNVTFATEELTAALEKFDQKILQSSPSGQIEFGFRTLGIEKLCELNLINYKKGECHNDTRKGSEFFELTIAL